MNHEHMNVKDEVEQAGSKKPWVTPRLDNLNEVSTEESPTDNHQTDGITYEDIS